MNMEDVCMSEKELKDEIKKVELELNALERQKKRNAMRFAPPSFRSMVSGTSFKSGQMGQFRTKTAGKDNSIQTVHRVASNFELPSWSQASITQANEHMKKNLVTFANSLSDEQLVNEIKHVQNEIFKLNNKISVTYSNCSKCKEIFAEDSVKSISDCTSCKLPALYHATCIAESPVLCYSCSTALGVSIHTTLSYHQSVNSDKSSKVVNTANPNELVVSVPRPLAKGILPKSSELLLHMISGSFEKVNASILGSTLSDENAVIDLVLLKAVHTIMVSNGYSVEQIAQFTNVSGGSAFIQCWLQRKLPSKVKIGNQEDVLRSWVKSQIDGISLLEQPLRPEDVLKLNDLMEEKSAHSPKLHKSSRATAAMPSRFAQFEHNEVFMQSEKLNVDVSTTPANILSKNIVKKEKHPPKSNSKHAHLLLNDDFCFVCGSEGKLICCDGCPNSAHAKCVGKHLKTLEVADSWFCNLCEGDRVCVVSIVDNILLEGKQAPLKNEIDFWLQNHPGYCKWSEAIKER